MNAITSSPINPDRAPRRLPKEIDLLGDYRLRTVRNYANSIGISTVRVYQKFQENVLEIVTVDGVQFVKVPKI